jgi:hypothetical protein
MNYDEARQRKNADGSESGMWDWTTKNDGRILIASPCSSKCEHRSQEEAERHFYEHSLESAVEGFHKNVQYPCAVCGEWTTGYMGNNDFSLLSMHADLCDNHRSKEELAKIFPFQGGGVQVVHS